MKIHLFTAEFPFLKSETFIENELPILASHSEKVTIYPYDSKGEEFYREIPENSTVLNRRDFESKQKFSFRDYLIIFHLLINEFFLSNNKWFYLKKVRTWLSLLKKAISTAKSIPLKAEDKSQVFYSFWMNDWATVLMILKIQGKIDHFVFRCGGFDIWDERHEGGYLPFRGIIYKHASGIYPNSKKAELYLRSKNLFPDKITHKYWGTKDLGICELNNNERFTIVSCSNVIPLKRVQLIIEILKELSLPVKWIHFGDGSEFDSIKTQSEALNDRHLVIFKGKTSNREVLEFYKENSVNLFITTSSTEGLPVSVQEAISFGIPVLATDVGGMSEVVNDQTGMLIDAEFEPLEIAKKIERFKNSNMNSIDFRKKVRAFWKANFKAKAVYDQFYNDLLSTFNHPD